MSRTLNIRLPDALFSLVQHEAEQEGRSLNNYIIRILTEGVRTAEGHSTLGASPGPRPDSMKGMPPKRTVKRASVKDVPPVDDMSAAQRKLAEIQKRQAEGRVKPVPEGQRVDLDPDEEKEYFKEMAKRQQGVGPEPWS